MPEHGGGVGDYDGFVVGGAGATNTALGILLIAMSEVLHVVVGAILVALGLFLLFYAMNMRSRAHAYAAAHHGGESQGTKEGSGETKGGTSGSGETASHHR